MVEVNNQVATQHLPKFTHNNNQAKFTPNNNQVATQHLMKFTPNNNNLAKLTPNNNRAKFTNNQVNTL